VRVLFITGNYLPGKNGGIENYTHWLASVLIQNNIDVEVAALNVKSASNYLYEKVKVNNLKGSFLNFETLLQTGNFDICHFQEYSGIRGIEMSWLIKAKEYANVYFTFHLPYFTCYKNDFRYKGIEDCNTFSDPDRCSRCIIADKSGYHRYRSEPLLSILLGISGITPIRQILKKRVTEQSKKLTELIRVCDSIFIYADWFKKILAENGYDEPTIKKIPYKTKTILPDVSDVKKKDLKNKILFVGRIEYQKGLHLLCHAMNELETGDIQLDVYGNIEDQAYFDKCFKKYPFNFKGTTNYVTLIKVFKEYDFAVMPSVFTEMYSLLIKDAFFEKLPVIASTAKGNRDAVSDGENGFLFNYNDAEDLASTIDKAYHLKKNGWTPVFNYLDNSERDVEEIISYYKIKVN